MDNERTRVCPVELASSLDNKIRKWLQDPHKILAPFIKEGMRVYDIGSGPGFFSLELAKLVGPNGKVLAADLQDGMLQKLGSKIKGTELEERIKLIKCEIGNVNVTEKVDFIIAFWMVHEVQDKNSFFKELRKILKDNGQFLIVEPKYVHVSQKAFGTTLKIAEENGFKIYQGPGIFFSQTAILKNA